MTDAPRARPLSSWIDIAPPGLREIEALLFQYQHSERWPPERLADDQFAALQELVRFARAEVPFFRGERHDLPLTSWDDWSRWPILTRSEVQTRGDALHPAALPDDHGATTAVPSLGSTGRPFETIQSERAALVAHAMTIREQLWHQRNLSQRLAVIRPHPREEAQDGKGLTSASWGASGSVFATGPAFLLSASEPVERVWAWLAEIGAAYLNTYPSVLHELALHNETQDRPLRFHQVITQGEVLSPETRHLAEASFEARICETYGTRETGYLAIECSVGGHQHVMAENAIVEILDSDGAPCDPGQLGRVIVTPLHNWATPLLRYEIGDYAVAGEPADCGITLPTIGRIAGRGQGGPATPRRARHGPQRRPMPRA